MEDNSKFISLLGSFSYSCLDYGKQTFRRAKENVSGNLRICILCCSEMAIPWLGSTLDLVFLGLKFAGKSEVLLHLFKFQLIQLHNPPNLISSLLQLTNPYFQPILSCSNFGVKVTKPFNFTITMYIICSRNLEYFCCYIFRK